MTLQTINSADLLDSLSRDATLYHRSLSTSVLGVRRPPKMLMTFCHVIGFPILHSGPRASTPFSTSSSWLPWPIVLFAPGLSFLRSMASSWTSSSTSKSKSEPPCAELESESLSGENGELTLSEPRAPERCTERTTSPLQIGQVRRLVVSQGVLDSPVSKHSLWRRKMGILNLHALGMEFVSTW